MPASGVSDSAFDTEAHVMRLLKVTVRFGLVMTSTAPFIGVTSVTWGTVSSTESGSAPVVNVSAYGARSCRLPELLRAAASVSVYVVFAANVPPVGASSSRVLPPFQSQSRPTVGVMVNMVEDVSTALLKRSSMGWSRGTPVAPASGVVPMTSSAGARGMACKTLLRGESPPAPRAMTAKK